jgi:RNA polymerase sigma-70 factor (ECF subfamily)
VRDSRLGDDADLLGAALARGEVDVKQIYDVHGPLVYAICRKSLGDDRAAEVTQDVFVSAWRAREQFDPGRGSLAAWLVGITKRRIIDHVRREQRHADRRADEGEADATAARTEPEVDRIADRMTLAQALGRLPDRPRQVIALAYVHGLTHQEIAERTGLPLGTIKSDIRRGLVALRDYMESIHE